MKVAILAGGQGLRLAEETQTKSKAMVGIGNEPILWHIMKYYGYYGYHDFVIALGYQGDSIRNYFTGMAARRPPSVNGEQTVCFPEVEPGWTVELIDTGLDTMSGGRIKRLSPYLGTGPFMLTWCDGLSDVDLNRLRAFHERHGRIGTLTAVHPPGRFGRLVLSGDEIVAFREKVEDPNEWINGAFFVFDAGVFDYIDGDATQFEREPLERLAADGQLMAYRHEVLLAMHGYWQGSPDLERDLGRGRGALETVGVSDARPLDRQRRLYRHDPGSLAVGEESRGDRVGQRTFSRMHAAGRDSSGTHHPQGRARRRAS